MNENFAEAHKTSDGSPFKYPNKYVLPKTFTMQKSLYVFVKTLFMFYTAI